MTDYLFLRVKATYAGSAIDASADESAVREQAAKGWDLVQILVENPAATTIDYVLIFKRSSS